MYMNMLYPGEAVLDEPEGGVFPREELAMPYIQSHSQVGNFIKHGHKMVITLAQVFNAQNYTRVSRRSNHLARQRDLSGGCFPGNIPFVHPEMECSLRDTQR